VNRFRALLSRLQDRFLSRWQRPAPRHTGRPPEAVSEPQPEPESKPQGVSPAQLTQMDGFPIARVAPYVDDPKRPRHRRPR
jgi:hypothetical protein